jgi:hypothetical protein
LLLEAVSDNFLETPLSMRAFVALRYLGWNDPNEQNQNHHVVLGPERRYNDNQQIPHYQVWELDFTFSDGRIDTAFADKNLLDRFVSCLETFREIERSRR